MEVEGHVSLSNDENIEMVRLIVIDHYFLILECDTAQDLEFLSVTANRMEHPNWEDQKFQIHHEAYFIEKIITENQKLLFSVGKDDCKLESACFLKIWDFNSLIAGAAGYQKTEDSGLNGGTLFERSASSDKDFKAKQGPKILHLKHKNGNEIQSESIKAIRVSPDGVLGALFLEEMNKILIYQFMDNKGDLLKEKVMQKAIEAFFVDVEGFENKLELYLLKNPDPNRIASGQILLDYQMYLVYKEGVLFYSNLDDDTEPIILL